MQRIGDLFVGSKTLLPCPSPGWLVGPSKFPESAEVPLPCSYRSTYFIYNNHFGGTEKKEKGRKRPEKRKEDNFYFHIHRKINYIFTRRICTYTYMYIYAHTDTYIYLISH